MKTSAPGLGIADSAAFGRAWREACVPCQGAAVVASPARQPMRDEIQFIEERSWDGGGAARAGSGFGELCKALCMINDSSRLGRWVMASTGCAGFIRSQQPRLWSHREGPLQACSRCRILVCSRQLLASQEPSGNDMPVATPCSVSRSTHTLQHAQEPYPHAVTIRKSCFCPSESICSTPVHARDRCVQTQAMHCISPEIPTQGGGHSVGMHVHRERGHLTHIATLCKEL